MDERASSRPSQLHPQTDRNSPKVLLTTRAQWLYMSPSYTNTNTGPNGEMVSDQSFLFPTHESRLNVESELDKRVSIRKDCMMRRSRQPRFYHKPLKPLFEKKKNLEKKRRRNFRTETPESLYLSLPCALSCNATLSTGETGREEKRTGPQRAEYQ